MSLPTLKELYPTVNGMLLSIDLEIKDSYKKIKKELTVEIINEKIKLLKSICENEKLDFNKMTHKYLSDKERKYVKINVSSIVSNDNLLDHIIINDCNYYYENKEDGNILDANNIVVGIYKNGTHIIHDKTDKEHRNILC
jgi:hypothetical protein